MQLSEAMVYLTLFTAKALIILLLMLAILLVFFTLLAKSKEKITKGKIVVKNLNKKYEDYKEAILTEISSKQWLKKFHKEKKAEEKAKEKSNDKGRNIYVVNFHGDMRATTVTNLSEEVTAILNVATPADEVIVRVESGGGVVHGYGLAAAQLMRIRARKIPLTVTIDKIAASGGYMMACVADKILCAPFAIVGSIGVIIQLPNFHRVLKAKHIDFEMLTAGEYKRTLTLFGENTEEGREKLQEEIEDIHQLFKNMISENRQQVDINKVATGEHWVGQQALGLKLVDEIKTSDDYLLERSKKANLYEVSFEVKKPFMSKFSAAANLLQEKMHGLNVFG